MATKKGVNLTFSIEEQEALTSIRNLTSQISTMNKELNLTDTTLKNDNASINDYKSKLTILTKQKETLTQKVSEANSMLEKAKETYGENSTQVQKWQNKLLDAQIAQAKVENQIQDTTKAIDNYGKETEEASEKTSVFGSVLKANLASEAIIAGAKDVVNVVKTIGSAVGEVIGDSIKAYADYEQLVGGVDTLFKDSSTKVQGYANEAYKTAGMSANQYMETVTSFSASLLQGLKGDTAKAGDVANQAVIDMSDNANKMGTDISLIQNAYQGFAKDNYTMLDNLKLGYGGTASEMARLVNDSGVMGKSFKATAENVKDIPFDKLIEAIHNTQDAMGITGTTAKEASETIEGSLNSVKSSWENVLASLASGNSEQINSTISGLVESIGYLADNILKILPNILDGLGQLVQNIITQMPFMIQKVLPTLSTMLKGLFQSIATVLPELITVVFEVIKTLANTIIENLPMILEAGIAIQLEIINGIVEALPELIPTIIDVVLLIVDTLLDNLDLIIIAAIDLIVALATGLVEALPKLVEKIPDIISKLVLALTDPTMLAKLLGAGITLIISLVGGIIATIPQLIAVGPRLVINLFNGIKDKILNTDWLGLGKDMVKGILNGILSIDDLIVKTAKSLKDKIVGSIKSLFGIHSPSRLMKKEVGLNIGLGVADGIDDSISSVDDAIQNLQSSAMSQIEPSIDIGAMTTKNLEPGTIRPLYITIEEFNNNRDQDVESLAEELAFYLKQKELA